VIFDYFEIKYAWMYRKQWLQGYELAKSEHYTPYFRSDAAKMTFERCVKSLRDDGNCNADFNLTARYKDEFCAGFLICLHISLKPFDLKF